jgi:hypothetical protein
MRYSASEKAEIIALVGLSGFLCEAGYPSCVHEALVEHDGELRLRLGPLARRAFRFRGGMVQDQIQQFGCGVIGRKMSSGANGAAQL